MPAPDYTTLLDIPAGVEGGIAAILDALSISGFTQRQVRGAGADKLPAERVDIRCTQGAWTGSWGINREGNLMRRAWRYTLDLDLHTDEASDAARHGEMRGLITTALMTAESFSTAFFPWHVLSTIQEAGCTEDVEKETDEDLSLMRYTGIVAIRSDAWPLV